jgi:hypothetical protein
MMYALLEPVIIGLIVLASAWHVLKLVMPRPMRRLRAVIGSETACGAAPDRAQSATDRLKAASRDNSCGACRGCDVSRRQGSRLLR